MASEGNLTAPLLSQTRVKVGTVDLPSTVFQEPLREHLIYEAVCSFMAARRQGSAATKTRGEVRGGGKKPWRQKGIGRARAGSTRSPVWVGGGTTFGPRPRSYDFHLPKRARRVAVRSVLAMKHREGLLTVVDNLALPEGKTKRMVEVIKALQLGRGVLIVVADRDRSVELASRNLPYVKVVTAHGLNVYDLLHYHHLVMTQDAVSRVAERLAR